MRLSLVDRYKSSKNDHTKIVRIDLDSPCRELSNGGLESEVALAVRWKIDFVCVLLIANPVLACFMLSK